MIQPAPKISIVTVCFNAADTLEEAILSVLAQDYPDMEYIIIDGASTDGTQDIIRKYENTLSYWVSEPDDGPVTAYYKALEHVTGDLVNFLNADDIYAPGILHEVAEAYRQDAGYEVISCGVSVQRLADKKEIMRSCSAKNIEFTLENMLFKHALFDAHFFAPDLFRRFNKIKKHARDGSHFYSCDRDFQVRLALAGMRNYVIEKPLYIYRSHEGSSTLSRSNIIKIRYEQMEIADDLLANIELSEKQRKVVKRYYRRHIALLFVLCVIGLRVKEAARAFTKGLRMRKLLWFYDLITEPLAELKYRLSVRG